MKSSWVFSGETVMNVDRKLLEYEMSEKIMPTIFTQNISINFDKSTAMARNLKSHLALCHTTGTRTHKHTSTQSHSHTRRNEARKKNVNTNQRNRKTGNIKTSKNEL